MRRALLAPALAGLLGALLGACPPVIAEPISVEPVVAEPVVAEPAPGLRFEGNADFSAPQLLAILRNRYHVPLQGDFGITDADDAAYFLRTFYFSRGYLDASVAYTYAPTRPPTLSFQVNEGPQRSIGRVIITGGPGIPPDQLREIFNATLRQATLRPFGPLRYVASAIEAGRLALLTAYAQQGYLTATATITDLPSARPRITDLHIQLDQGIRYFVRAVHFALPPGPRPPASGASPAAVPVTEPVLRALLAGYLDRPYQRNQEALMRTRVQDALRDRGYLQAQVTTTTQIHPTTGRVDLTFHLTPGRTYRIGTIRVQGATFTRSSAILARFGIPSGTPYDASLVDAAARRLWFTGAFAQADVQRQPNPPHQPPGTVDLLLKVEETPAKRIQLGLGYSQWDRALADIHYIDRNFLGTLNRLSVDATLSQRSYLLTTSLTDPWLLGTPLEGTISLATGRRELPAYRSVETGGTLTLARSHSATTLTGYQLQYGYKNVTDAVIFGDDPANPDPNYTLGSLSLNQTYDTRNNLLSPMTGLYLNHEIEFANPALLGNISYLRLSAQATFYLPLRPITATRPFIPFLIFNHRAGLLLPYGSTTSIPVQERFFLGGPNTVRSYQLDGLGPQDRDGDPLGGLATLLWNAEIQWPVYNNLYLAAFADAGNLWSQPSDLRPTDLKVGIGPGLRLYTPLGAVRIDYGYNLNPSPNAPIGAWQVGFGFTF